MPIFRMRGLGTKGVVTDTPAFELPPDTWSNASNVRFHSGRIEKIGGNEPVLLKGRPHEPPLSIVQRSNTEALIYGTPTKLYMVEGVNHSDISADKLDADGKPVVDSEGNPVRVTYEASPGSTWYYTTLSNAMIMTTPLNDPQGMTPTDAKFVTLPGWGKGGKADDAPVENWKTPRIRAFKNYLIALSMIEDGVHFPQRVRWSDVAYINMLPFNWHHDDPNTDGGFNDLTNSIGKIVDGVPLRDSFVIYTDRDTYLMDYVGGNDIFTFRKLFSDSGILAPECACEFEGQHFVISESDIFVHNGSTRRSVASGRIKQYLMKEISSVNFYATKVFAYQTMKEIWITYVSPGFTKDSRVTDDVENFACNKAAVWNWEYDTWTFYELPKALDVNMAFPPTLDTRAWDQYCGTETQISGTPPDGVITDAVIPPGCDDLWNGASHSEEIWEEFGQSFKKQVLYCASADGNFYLLDKGYYFYYKGDEIDFSDDFSRRPVVAFLEKRSMDFDEQEQQTYRHKFLRGIYPQFSGTGNIRFFVGGSNDPESSPSWDSNEMFAVGQDYKIDCFSNYRYPSIRVQDTSEGEWVFTGMDIDYFMEGTR